MYKETVVINCGDGGSGKNGANLLSLDKGGVVFVIMKVACLTDTCTHDVRFVTQELKEMGYSIYLST